MGKDAFYFSHDCNARNDPKILALRSIHGAKGYGYFWMIVEIMREQEDYKLKKGKYIWNTLAMQLGTNIDEIKEFVDDCINEFELFNEDDKYIWSKSLLRRMEIKDKKKAKKVKAGKKGAQARWGSDDKGKPKQKNSTANNNANGTAITKDGKRKERKEKKENKESKLKKENEIKGNISDNERKILNTFKKIKNYPFDFERDLEFIRELADLYPDADILDQSSQWKFYKLDNPLKKNHNPRSQFHRWVKNRKKYQSDTKDSKEDEKKKIEQRKKEQQEMVNRYG